GAFVYKGLDVPTRQILDSMGANKSSNTSDGLAAIQAQLTNLSREIIKVNERVYASQVGCELCSGPHYTKQTMEETLSYFMVESAKRHEKHSSLIKEIRASTDATIRNQIASIKALKIQIRQTSKVLQERGFRGLPNSIETNPKDHVKSITTVEETKTSSICHIRSNQYAISNQQRDERMSLIELSRPNILFPGHLKEYGYDEKEVLREFKKLQVSLTESTSSLRRLLGETWRIEEEIKAKINEHCLVILKIIYRKRKKTHGVLLCLELLIKCVLIKP
nr:hypothetical protein [Tanacetum cinerariifolium]